MLTGRRIDSSRARADLHIKVRPVPSDFGVCKVLENALTTAMTERFTQGRGVDQLPQTVSEFVFVPLMKDQTRIADYVRYFAGIRTHHTGLARHGFYEDTAKLFFPVAASTRRQCKDIERVHVVHNFVRVNPRYPVDSVLKLQLPNHTLQ